MYYCSYALYGLHEICVLRYELLQNSISKVCQKKLINLFKKDLQYPRDIRLWGSDLSFLKHVKKCLLLRYQLKIWPRLRIKIRNINAFNFSKFSI